MRREGEGYRGFPLTIMMPPLLAVPTTMNPLSFRSCTQLHLHCRKPTYSTAVLHGLFLFTVSISIDSSTPKLRHVMCWGGQPVAQPRYLGLGFLLDASQTRRCLSCGCVGPRGGGRRHAGDCDGGHYFVANHVETLLVKKSFPPRVRKEERAFSRVSTAHHIIFEPLNFFFCLIVFR